MAITLRVKSDKFSRIAPDRGQLSHKQNWIVLLPASKPCSWYWRPPTKKHIPRTKTVEADNCKLELVLRTSSKIILGSVRRFLSISPTTAEKISRQRRVGVDTKGESDLHEDCTIRNWHLTRAMIWKKPFYLTGTHIMWGMVTNGHDKLHPAVYRS